MDNDVDDSTCLTQVMVGPQLGTQAASEAR